MTTIAETTCIETKATMNRGWAVLRLFLGIVVLTAAVLKAHQLATQPSLGEGLLHARWFNILVVEFEIFFGIWLLLGLMPKLTWLASIGCFLVFASVSAYKGFAGEASCGCFGAATINPWLTMMFDLVIVGLLIAFRPRVKWTLGLNTAKQHVLNYCLIVIPLCGFVLWGMSQVKFLQLQEIGQVLEHGSIVKLDPRSWIDKEFPLRDHCDIGETIATGQWIVLLHRSGCSECREASPLIADLVRQRNCSFVILEMNSHEDALALESMNPLTGLMNQEISWFAETPVVLELEDGFVKQVLLREDLKRMRSSDSTHSLLFGQVSPMEVTK